MKLLKLNNLRTVNRAALAVNIGDLFTSTAP